MEPTCASGVGWAGASNQLQLYVMGNDDYILGVHRLLLALKGGREVVAYRGEQQRTALHDAA